MANIINLNREQLFELYKNIERNACYIEHNKKRNLREMAGLTNEEDYVDDFMENESLAQRRERLKHLAINSQNKGLCERCSLDGKNVCAIN
ncbi:MAG: hypothetical protein LBM01_01690 [Christensenellaceae bacterium]|jgi:hypothetical protein|nr:hypothetical protein [Christensenellaceae bacterium]